MIQPNPLHALLIDVAQLMQRGTQRSKHPESVLRARQCFCRGVFKILAQDGGTRNEFSIQCQPFQIAVSPQMHQRQIAIDRGFMRLTSDLVDVVLVQAETQSQQKHQR